MRKVGPEERRATAYRAAFATESAETMLIDLIAFAQEETDPIVRCGRLDMMARIIRERGKIPNPAPSVYEQE